MSRGSGAAQMMAMTGKKPRAGRQAAEAAHQFATAVQHHQAGRLREAEHFYRQALAADPKHVDSLHLLGVLAHQVGRSDLAIDLIGKALALNERIPEFHYNIGLAFSALRRFGEAAAHNRRAVGLRPDYAEAHLNLGNALNAQGQHVAALASYQRALALRPGSPELHYNIANALAETGRTDDAITHYRQALALRPDYAEAHNNLGAALVTCDELEEAAACFQRALALKPDLPGTGLGLARVLVSLLRPGGLMRIALCSTRARRDITAARRLIAERGWPSTPEGIRQARQAILALPDGAPERNVATLIDFFSLSDCRDLLFHVQEHTFGIPEIARFLAEAQLEFLGFEVRRARRANTPAVSPATRPRPTLPTGTFSSGRTPKPSSPPTSFGCKNGPAPMRRTGHDGSHVGPF